MPLDLQWAQPNPALGPTYGLEFYARIISHYGMIFAALFIAGGFAYMFATTSTQGRQKGIKVVVGSAMALVLLALLPSIIDKLLVPSGASFGITQPPGGTYVFPAPATASSSGDSWLGKLLAGAFGWMVGGVVSSLLALVTGFLNITLFHTYSLVDGGGFAQSVWSLYRVTAPIATGILAILLAYSFSKQAVGGSLLETGNTFDRSNLDPRILLPRAIAATLMAWVGFYVIGFILEISNYMVNFFLHQTYSAISTNFWGKLGSDIAALGTGLVLAWAMPLITPFLTLILVGLIAWIVITYYIRLFEITFLTALLPIASAFWTMNETSNIWSAYIAEIFGAIFIQPLQVFMWWVVVKLITGSGTPVGVANASANTFFEGIIGLFFMASAPTLLKRFIGHNVAGGSLTGQVLEAMGVRSAVKKAWQASPASQVIDKAHESLRSGHEQKLRQWGETGARSGSLLGKGVGALAGAATGLGGTAANIGVGAVKGFASGGVYEPGGSLGTRIAGIRSGVASQLAARGGFRQNYGAGASRTHDLVNKVDPLAWAARGGANTGGRIFTQSERRAERAKSQNALKAEKAGLEGWTDGTPFAQELIKSKQENDVLSGQKEQKIHPYRGMAPWVASGLPGSQTGEERVKAFERYDSPLPLKNIYQRIKNDKAKLAYVTGRTMSYGSSKEPTGSERVLQQMRGQNPRGVPDRRR